MSSTRRLVMTALALAFMLPQGLLATMHNIDISNFAFTPTNTVIAHGDTVRWTLVSGVHSTTSELDSPKSWDSGVMSSGGSTFDVVFTAADGFGPWPYYCTVHPATMKDTIRYAPPAVPTLTAEPFASGFDRPVFATSPPGDFERLFVLEQHTGMIKIVNIQTGAVNGTAFLDIGSLISGGNEQGLLGLAFHPDYDQNGYFYVNYTDGSGDTKVVRYQVSGDPDIADAGTAFTILFLDQPFSNHNGGWIAFGDDGYLYIATGDGGAGGDPGNRAQDITTLFGKILRIDVDGGSPYANPSDNPFVGIAGEDEIWHYGVRNPWRCSFDRLTNDLYIGDVGQGDYEEISFQASDTSGINFGWRLKEGTHCYDPPTLCDPGGITTDPIHEYDHGPHCSVTGGYVYRGCVIPELVGTYFFADYCSDSIWTFRYDGNTKIDSQNRTAELGAAGVSVVSFAEDNFGELYILKLSGDISKIVPAAGITDCNENGIHDACEIEYGLVADDDDDGIPDDCAGFICGDADGNAIVNISDAVYLIAYIFGGGPAPVPLLAGDADCNSIVNISDAVYLIAYIFGGGPAPCDSCP